MISVTQRVCGRGELRASKQEENVRTEWNLAVDTGGFTMHDGRFEDPEDAKRAVEELVKEREELLCSSTALERLIDNQKQVRIVKYRAKEDSSRERARVTAIPTERERARAKKRGESERVRPSERHKEREREQTRAKRRE